MKPIVYTSICIGEYSLFPEQYTTGKCRWNVKFVNVERGGTSSSHWASLRLGYLFGLFPTSYRFIWHVQRFRHKR